MDKTVIKTIIKAKQQEISRIRLTPRPISFESGTCYVLVGIRRAGKSYLLVQDIQQQVAAGRITLEECLYINFEDERLAELPSQELAMIIDCYQEMYGPKKPWVYLDEIQNIDGWEKFVRRLADEKYRVMVTGSNAKMLSKEIASTLGGRYIIREISPFSYREYLSYHGLTPVSNWEYHPDLRAEAAHRFDDYFYHGGFAEMFSLVGKREWLNSLYQKILMGDIISRNKIRGDRQLRLLARKVAENVMQPTAISRFVHIIVSSGDKISNPTVKDYLGYMEDNYLIFSLPNFASPDSEQETFRKRYFMDNGILNLFLTNGETKLLENICAIHLWRRYHDPDEPGLFFYKRNIEVDFYIPDAKMAIQSAFSLSDPETRTREIESLAALHKAFPLQKACIVTWDQEETIKKDDLTIEVVPVWKWLLR